MTDSRDRGDGQGDDGESLVPRGRKRRALRVPVDDVPRQSFVDMSRPPSREAVVVQPAAEAPPAPAPVLAAPRQRLPSVEVSLDAELEVEPAPPPRPRSYRPPPPPPGRSAQATPDPAPEPTPEPAELASEPTRVSPPPDPDAAADAPVEIDWGGGHDGQEAPSPRSPWEETTKVGKKRSSAPPSAETPAMLPDDPLEAPRASSPSVPPPRPPSVSDAPRASASDADTTAPRAALDDDDASFDAIPTAVSLTTLDSRPPRPDPRPASVPPVPEAPRAPRGLFGGSGSTEIGVGEDFADTVFAPVEEIPRPKRITAAMPTRRSHEPTAPGALAEPRGEVDAATERAAVPEREVPPVLAEPPHEAREVVAHEASGAEPPRATGHEPEAAHTPEASDAELHATAPHHPGEPQASELPAAELDSTELVSGELHTAELGEPEPPEADSPPDAAELESVASPRAPSTGETLVGVGAPGPAPAVVTMQPVVVVQRAVSVIGSPSQPPPEPRVALTTPGGIGAPIEPPPRESDPGLHLDLEPDSAMADEAEIVEVPISTPAPPKPAPPQAKPPAPPPAPRAAPPAPPTAAPAPAIATEQPAQAPSRPPPKKKHQWWEELFNDDYLRTVPIPSPKNISKQCDFIEARLGLAKGATILDVGCGLGLHAIELTRRGFLVVGLDLSLPMLSRAADEAQDQGFKINFLHADMREMNFEGAFDAVLLWGTTLGYFDDDTNRQVLERAYRALKPGGLLLLEVVNRDFAVKSQPNLVWFQGDGCVVMEETSFNFISSRLLVKRNVILDDGRQRETTYSVRLYSLHELGQVLHLRGFRVVEISGREATPAIFFGADSPKLIILAERRVQAAPAPPAPPKKGEDGPRTGETSLPPSSPTPSENGGTPAPS